MIPENAWRNVTQGVDVNAQLRSEIRQLEAKIAQLELKNRELSIQNARMEETLAIARHYTERMSNAIG